MSRRVVTLIERRSRLCRLPREEFHFLLTEARPIVEVVPAAERGWYQLTARGWVGFFDSPSCRYVLQPKLPWPNFLWLLGLRPHEATDQFHQPDSPLIAAVAEALASRWDDVLRRGLVAGYREAESQSRFLRGKLRLAEQLREAATAAFPEYFHVTEPILDLDTAWHRIPKAAASQLLRSGAVPPAIRPRLQAIVQVLASVTEASPTEADFAAALAEPRAEQYRELLELCRVIVQGFPTASVLPRSSLAAFLIDLGRVFEQYLIRSLRQELAPYPGWEVGSQGAFELGPTVLRPDIVIRRAGSAWAVLDAKWKKVAAEASDLHQILAYRTLTGANRVGLVYPGRSDDFAHYFSPDGRIRVSLYRLRVVGREEQLERSIRRLARWVRTD
ncbi:MAG: hypothetical protein RMJ56_14915 [Gemmataceae bacterium]|nr:McrC family protein [Gemmata sp.]MDW8198887.1 hypothetical protein [Gemmataceae bacterium]